jgi:hypothetical protein
MANGRWQSGGFQIGDFKGGGASEAAVGWLRVEGLRAGFAQKGTKETET